MIFLFSFRSASPYGLRRQSSLPITTRDHINQMQHPETVSMAIHKPRNERPTSSLSNQTDPIVKPLLPDNNMIDLNAALQAVSAVATGPVVTRIPLQNSLVTNSQNIAQSTDNPSHGNAASNHDSETTGDLENEEYLYRIQMYGVLLRMMGDQLDADYATG